MGEPIENKEEQKTAIEEDTAFLPGTPLVFAQKLNGYATKGYMTYMPEDPLQKAERMAVEMRRSRRRDLIASKRALRNPHTTEEAPICPTCGGQRGDPDTQSLQGGPFTEILSMLPGEVRMEEPEQTNVEEPPRTQQVDKEGQTSEMDLSSERSYCSSCGFYYGERESESYMEEATGTPYTPPQEERDVAVVLQGIFGRVLRDYK